MSKNRPPNVFYGRCHSRNTEKQVVHTLIMAEDILSRKFRLNSAAGAPHARSVVSVEHSTYSWKVLQKKRTKQT